MGLPEKLQAGDRRTDTRAGSVFGRLLEAHISPSQSIPNQEGQTIACDVDNIFTRLMYSQDLLISVRQPVKVFF